MSEHTLGFSETQASHYEQAELRRLILDETVALPASGRSNGELFGRYQEQDLIEYGEWLCNLLQLVPGEEPPLKATHIERASKLNLGPSQMVFKSVMGGVIALKQELGFAPPAELGEWGWDEFINEGMKLAKSIGRRPGRVELLEAYRAGRFPSERALRSRFGNLQNYHELIGFPSVKGWELEDYDEWGVAFKRQNGAEVPITNDALLELSARGTGPSNNSVRRIFGGIPRFDNQVNEKFTEIVVVEKQEKALRLQNLTEEAAKDPVLSLILDQTSDDQVLRVAGQYTLIRHFLPTLPVVDLKRVSRMNHSDLLEHWIVRRRPDLLIADVENTASMLDVFDDLWPLYRFQNVDLYITPAG